MSIEDNHHVEWLAGFMREVSRLVEPMFDEMGSVLPTCWFVTAEGVEHMLFDGNIATKDAFAASLDAFEASLRKYISENDVICYACVTRALMKRVTAKGGGILLVRPPEETIDTLNILAENRQQTISGFRRIIQPAQGERPYLGELEMNDGVFYSRFGNLLCPRAAHQ
jgi:hypothetical protein